LASDSQKFNSQPLSGSNNSVEPSDPQEMIREYETCGFSIGVAVDKNKRYRRTMEDAHCYFYNFNEKQGSGFFAIYDGHAGKSAADYCQKYLHEVGIEI
jgi:protein phosphatase PTC1